MFEDIGKKIKMLARVLCWIGIALFFLIGFVVVVSSEDRDSSVRTIQTLTGLGIMIGGPLASWLSSFLLYGFGELIDTNCSIAANMRHLAVNSTVNSIAEAGSVAQADSGTNEPASWQTAARGTCAFCGKQDVSLYPITIRDGKKTILRTVCKDCLEEHNAKREKLSRLDDLLNSGLITQEEYDQRKADI